MLRRFLVVTLATASIAAAPASTDMLPGVVLRLGRIATPGHGTKAAGIGKQFEALLHAVGRTNQRAMSSRPSRYTIQFFLPFYVCMHAAQTHAALLLRLSSPLRRLNFLPLATTALVQAHAGTQAALAGVYAAVGFAWQAGYWALPLSQAAAAENADEPPRILEHLRPNELRIHLA